MGSVEIGSIGYTNFNNPGDFSLEAEGTTDGHRWTRMKGRKISSELDLSFVVGHSQ